MSRSTNTPEAAAAAGAKFLDKVKPGWFRQVNIARLDLSNTLYCILPQVFKRDDYGVGQQGLEDLIDGMLREKVSDDTRTHSLNIPGITATAEEEINVETHVKVDYVALGFERPAEEDNGFYSRLTEAWVRLIKTRRARPSPSKRKGRR